MGKRKTYIVNSFLYRGRFTGLLRQWRTRSTHKQREGNMNTIQVVNSVGQTVNYTESEIKMIIDNGVRSAESSVQLSDKIKDIKYKVRDFFSEGEWQDGETTISKGDVNLLLESIGCNKLTTQYSGTFTITGSFTVEAEEEEEAESMFTDNVDVSFNDGDYTVDQVEVHDLEEDN